MPEIVHDGDGNAFELRASGTSMPSAHLSLRDALDHARSIRGVLSDLNNREALAEALVEVGKVSRSDAISLSFEEIRTLMDEVLSAGSLALVPYVPSRRPPANVFEPATTLSDLSVDEEPEVLPTHTLEISLVDAHGEPVAREAYRVELPSGQIVEGRLNAQGAALITGIEGSGSCTVNFPNWDQDAWAPA